MNVALFGTSADPPTKGHQMILSWLSQNFDICAVWVSDNPFKSHQATLEQRIAMMQLTIQSLDPVPDNLQLHPEISSPRTFITVAKAREIWPQADFTLAIGADLVGQLPSWYRAEELLRQVKVAIVPRPGYSLPDRDLEVLRRRCASVEIADLVVPSISSSDYRSNRDPSGIIPSVAAYIYQEHLYACQEAKPNIHWQISK